METYTEFEPARFDVETWPARPSDKENRQTGEYRARIEVCGQQFWFVGSYNLGKDALVSSTVEAHILARFVLCRVFTEAANA